MLGPRPSKPQRAWDLVQYLKGNKHILDTRYFDRDMSASEIKKQIVAHGDLPLHADNHRPTTDFLVRRGQRFPEPRPPMTREEALRISGVTK